MKRAVIFLHGNKQNDKDIKKYVKKTDTIICADGGTQYALEAGLLPDIVLGDFDSLAPKFQKRLKELGIPLQEFPTEKNFTDSELAIMYAINHDFQDLIFFGAFGNRIDHFLANIDFLARKAKDGIKITIIDNHQTLYFITSLLEIQGKKGDYLSLIPLQKDVEVVFTDGLKWVLSQDTLCWGETRGVSNEFTKAKAKIVIKKGILLAIHTPRS